jgi:circadian clock protein KaiB
MSRAAQYKFRLYVADSTHNSAMALANLTAICKKRLAGDFELEVVDVFKEPTRAAADGIRMTPTLIRLLPGPTRKIVGNLSDTPQVMHALGLPADAP